MFHVALLLPGSVSAASRRRFESLLSDLAALVSQPAAEIAPSAAPTGDAAAGRVSGGLVKGAGLLSRDLVAGAGKLSQYMASGARRLQSHMSPDSSLERAGSLLACSLASDAVTLVETRYGSDASRVTEDGLHAAGHLAMAGHSVQLLGAKGIARRVVKDTGKQLIHEHDSKNRAPFRRDAEV